MAAELRLGTKVFYKIGEVSALTKLPAYVLRFWESEFSFLKPKKSSGHQRLYVQRDVETVLEIKRMLYEEGYTIPGLKKLWSKRIRPRAKRATPRVVASRIKGEVVAILRMLESSGSPVSRGRQVKPDQLPLGLVVGNAKEDIG
jgi:DNA-binding transcriptional MerR regulator